MPHTFARRTHTQRYAIYADNAHKMLQTIDLLAFPLFVVVTGIIMSLWLAQQKSIFAFLLITRKKKIWKTRNHCDKTRLTSRIGWPFHLWVQKPFE